MIGKYAIIEDDGSNSLIIYEDSYASEFDLLTMNLDGQMVQEYEYLRERLSELDKAIREAARTQGYEIVSI